MLWLRPSHSGLACKHPIHQTYEVSYTDGCSVDDSIDLWADAANQLSEADKRNLNFDNPDKRRITADLLALAQSSEREANNKRWTYTRKRGEKVILRDVFAKIVHWVNVFKQVGDAAVQYDPGHAALPWAGVRFILQVKAKSQCGTVQ